MRRLLQTALVLTLLLGVLATPASAVTFTVCPTGPPTCDFASIQPAVDAAAPGDTITVADGTYAGDVTIATGGLTLAGANAGIPAGVTPGVRGAESVIQGRIATSGSVAGLTVDGFTILPPTNSGLTLTGTATITIANSIIDGGAPTDGSATATGNFETISLVDNTMRNFQFILNLDGGATVLASVMRNEISDFEFVGVLLQGSAQGASQIIGNRIHDGGAGSAGIALATDNNEIRENEIFNVNTGIALISDAGGTSSNVITFNIIRDNQFGLYADPGSGGPFVDNHVNRNAITNNGVGVRNDNAVQLDATCNWWGDASGPTSAENPAGTGDSEVGNIDFASWLLTADLNGVCGGAQVTCDGAAATIVGTIGDDALTGTPGDDVIAGLGGNDTIDGLGGNDRICGGDGNDSITGGEGDDRLFGQGDVDTINGGIGADLVDGGRGDDVGLFGGPGDDRVTGGAGNDSELRGQAGNDLVMGATGNDHRLLGNAGNDRIIGGPGDDTKLIGGQGIDVANGRQGIDTCDAETTTQCEGPA